MNFHRILRRGRRYYPQHRRWWWPFWRFYYREGQRIGFASKQAAATFLDEY
jgi:hypothetical protein